LRFKEGNSLEIDSVSNLRP